jgi:hypothetical protein
MTSVQAVPPRVRLSNDWARLVEKAVLDGAIVSSWCHPRALLAHRPPSWPGVTTVALGELPLQLVMAQPSAAVEPVPRKVLLPRKSATPLLHETLAWQGFQVEQHPVSCQDVPAWLKRMRERELAMPICPGLLEPGWLRAQGLIPHPQQPPLRETLWLLLPEGRMLCNHPARHLIRILRQRVEKGEEAWIPGGEHATAEPAQELS